MQTISDLIFCHGDSCQGKIASKTFTVGWVKSDVSSHAHTCLHLSGGELVRFGVVMTTLKIIQNERLNDFEGRKYLFLMY